LSQSANFSKIYKFYDGINLLLTLGFDKSWRNKASLNLKGKKVLDLGSGTGAAAKQLINYEVTALDPDENMLSLNEIKNKVVGSAEKLPFEDNSFDGVYCAFVWRNITDMDKSFAEIKRVLKEDGVFVLLDMTRPVNIFTKTLHQIATFFTLHLIGIITLNLKQYRFLHTSLDKLDPPEVFLKQSDFNEISIQRMGIFGFVYLAVLNN